VFEIGQEVRRQSEIHDQLGGQRQGGISTPKDHPYIFIFTSENGHQHGYSDGFRDDGTYWYTGEGQKGDMKMKGGNKAILNHSKDGKTIYVFEQTRKAHVRCIGTAEYIDHHEEQKPDTDGNLRRAYIFHLEINSIAVSNVAEEPPTYFSTDLSTLKQKRGDISALRDAALQHSSQRSTVQEKVALTAYRAEAIKLYVKARANGICEGCKKDAPFNSKKGPYLECHHLYRLADGGPDHPENVIALCPNCHRRAHLSTDHSDFNAQLMDIVKRIESNIT